MMQKSLSLIGLGLLLAGFAFGAKHVLSMSPDMSVLNSVSATNVPIATEEIPIVVTDAPMPTLTWGEVQAQSEARRRAAELELQQEQGAAIAAKQAQEAQAAWNLQQRLAVANSIRDGMRAREEWDKSEMEYRIQVDAANAAAAPGSMRSTPPVISSRPVNKTGH